MKSLRLWIARFLLHREIGHIHTLILAQLLNTGKGVKPDQSKIDAYNNVIKLLNGEIVTGTKYPLPESK